MSFPYHCSRTRARLTGVAMVNLKPRTVTIASCVTHPCPVLTGPTLAVSLTVHVSLVVGVCFILDIIEYHLFFIMNGFKLRCRTRALIETPKGWMIFSWPGPVFCLLLGVSSDYAQPITDQITEVTCPVIGQAQAELTLSKRQKTGPGSMG